MRVGGAAAQPAENLYDGARPENNAYTTSRSLQPWSRVSQSGSITDDYEGEHPWAFVGGTIHKAVIDVSGEPFADLAEEAKMAFARD